MHIPDGFLDPKTATATAVLSATGFSLALREAKRRMAPRKVPLMGLAAAFVFAAQMLNFPVGAGTSGHLMGGVLVSVLLGPSAAVLVMTSVLIVQCLLFADGGVLALGANIFNMAIIGTVGGYGIYRVVYRMVPDERGRLLAVAFSSWCSTVAASICCAGELAWSGTVAWNLGFPAMANVHMLIGVGEALITALVIAAIGRTRAELLPERKEGMSAGEIVAYGSIIVLGLVLFVSPFASSWPDGLEKVAGTLGFEQRAVSAAAFRSPLAEYQLPWIGSATQATALAGVAGSVVVFSLSALLARLIVPKSHDHQPMM